MSPRTVRQPGAMLAAAMLGAALVAGSGGCATPPTGGSTVVETGGIERIAASQRAAPVKLDGRLLDGTPWRLADQAGKVVVVNVWYSTCGPCEAEMPLLERAWKQLSAKHPDLRFMGIDFGESPETVSYTHLDVYKRQGRRRVTRRCAAGRPGKPQPPRIG